MSRGLTSGMTTAVTAERLEPIILAEADFDSGAVRVWSGIGDLSWDSKTWTGVGDLGSVAFAAETGSLVATSAVLTLSGIPSSLIAIALAEDYQERPANIWFGALDTDGSVIADPEEIHGGRMDVMTIDEDADTATVSVSVESNLIHLEVPKQRNYTPEDQKEEFSGDTGFDQVAALQDAEIVWGNGG